MLKYPFRKKPFKHQMECLERSVMEENFALLMEMGTGKTKVIIDTIAINYDRGVIDAALITVRKGAMYAWVEDGFSEHLPNHVKANIVVWKPNATKTVKAAIESLFNPDDTRLQIFVMNSEAFATDKGYRFAEAFLRSHKALWAIDESTDFKNHDTDRTKAILDLRGLAKMRRIATGSAVTRAPLDLYSQCAFLDPDLLGFGSYYAFRNRYAVVQKKKFPGAKREATIVVGYRNQAELAANIKPFSYRVTKEQCLDLPAKNYRMRYVDFTPEQIRAYVEMLEEATLTLKDQEDKLTAPFVITQMLRLHQICCGHVTLPDKNVLELKNNRVKALMEELENVEGKAIVWATYRHDIRTITQELAKAYGRASVVEFFGDTCQDERTNAVRRFQSERGCRWFVANPSTGGFGITLTAARDVIYFSNSYRLEHRLQSEDRAHRIGQTGTVTYTDLAVKGTVDEKIIKALKKKHDIASLIMGDGLRDWLSYDKQAKLEV